jgi:hypothetical protein
MPEFNQEARRYPRFNLEPGCTVQFKAANSIYEDLPVKDIGMGGIGVLIPSIPAQSLEKDMLLLEMILGHPKLPCSPNQGRVAFLLGKQNPDPNALLVMGIEFVNTHVEFKSALESLIDQLRS